MMRRNTVQRQKVLEYLISVKTHPTAEMVFEAIKDDLKGLTLATVYRNLNLLAKENKILKLEVNGEMHFDADISKHQHFVCDDCDEMYDVFEEEVSNYALKNIKTFEPYRVQIIYRGSCNNCKQKK